MVAGDRLVQHRGALRPGPDRLVADGEGAQYPPGQTPAGLGLLVVDAAARGVEQHRWSAQAVRDVEQVADDGVPGLVGHALRPAGEVLGAHSGGGVGAQVRVKVAGPRSRPEDLSGQGILGGDDVDQLLARPLVDLGGIDGGPEHTAHPAGVAARPDALAGRGEWSELAAQVAAEAGHRLGGVVRGELEVPTEGALRQSVAAVARLAAGSGGQDARQVVGLPGDGLDLATRRQNALGRTDRQGVADSRQGPGCGTVPVTQVRPVLYGGGGTRQVSGQGGEPSAHALEG